LGFIPKLVSCGRGFARRPAGELVPAGANLKSLWGDERTAEGELVMEGFGVEIFVVSRE